GIWSVHDVPPSLRKFVRGGALGEDMIKIISASKLCLNTHGDFMRYGGNLRLFEAAGAGICQLSDDLPGTRLWFPEIDGTPTIITYADEDDLHAKTAYYLAHDDQRQAIAQAAQAHVYANHTYDRRAEQLDQLLSRSGGK
ncbi:MAG: glycosyltransferase, partial [Chloroflexota bacterium]